VLREVRGRYVVRACGVRAGFRGRRFRCLDEAVTYSDYLAFSCPGAVCWISRVRDGEVVYRTAPYGGPESGDGTEGVREPRRPFPGSSAGSIALDLPD